MLDMALPVREAVEKAGCGKRTRLCGRLTLLKVQFAGWMLFVVAVAPSLLARHQQRRKGDAVDRRGQRGRCASQLSHRGQQIPERHQLRAARAGRDCARPRDGEALPDATLPQEAFVAAQSASAVEGLEVDELGRAVVGDEEDARGLPDAQVRQLVEQGAHHHILRVHGGGVRRLLGTPIMPLANSAVRERHRPAGGHPAEVCKVGRVAGHVQEERGGEGGVVAQETSTGVGDQVVEPEAAALCGDAVRASLGILWQMKLPVAALHARWIPGARGEV